MEELYGEGAHRTQADTAASPGKAGADRSYVSKAAEFLKALGKHAQTLLGGQQPGEGRRVRLAARGAG